MDWLLLTSGTAFASAFVPVLNLELFLVGLLTQQPGLPWWGVALVAAVAQVAGKLVFYLAGRGALWLPGWLHRRHRERGRGRIAYWLRRFRVLCRRRPVWTAAVLFLSALVGLPPFAATSLLAGTGGVPLTVFLATSLTGRTIRFAAIAAAPKLFGF